MTRWLWYAGLVLGGWWVGRHWDTLTFANDHQRQLEGAGDILGGLGKVFGGS